LPKLNSLKPRLGTLQPRLGSPLGDRKAQDRYRRDTQPWRSWYNTAEWQRLRDQVLKRDKWTCQRTGTLCLGKGNEPDAPVVNHKRPHRGDRALFFDIHNLEVVTKQVHDSLIKAEENKLSIA
jgi:5-methylcytosine-specific restriction enzyme A